MELLEVHRREAEEMLGNKAKADNGPYQSLPASQAGWTYLVVGPCPRGRALRNVIFPRIWLACSLLLRIQKERIKQQQ